MSAVVMNVSGPNTVTDFEESHITANFGNNPDSFVAEDAACWQGMFIRPTKS